MNGDYHLNKQDHWRKEHTRFYGFRLSNESDIRIIEYLDNISNKNDVIRKALNYYIDKEEKENGFHIHL